MTTYSLVAHLDEATGSSPTGQPLLVTLGDEERAAFAMSPDAPLDFDLPTLPSAARFTVAVGTNARGPAAQTDSTIEAAILVSDGDDYQTLWRETLHTTEAGQEWRELEVDLGGFAGRPVRLRLTGGAPSRPALGLYWGAPVLHSDGRSTLLSDWPIRRRALVESAELEQGSITIRVPEGGSLEFRGYFDMNIDRMTPDRVAKLGPVDFVCRLADQTVLEKQLVPTAYQQGFFTEVDVSGRAGETLDVSCGISSLQSESRDFARFAPLRVYGQSTLARLPAASGPNLLLLVVDTVRADHLSLYGYERPTTPNLETLAESSLVFDAATSQSSWTMPATASLLTGLYPPSHGVRGGYELPADIPTLATRLEAHGFTTFAVSGNPVVGRREGLAQGFQTFVQLRWARAETLNRQLFDLLEEHRDVRWFAYAHYIDPHDSYEAPPSHAGRFNGARTPAFEKRAFSHLAQALNRGDDVTISGDDLAYQIAAYDEEILYWDHELGSLVRHLKALDLFEDTVIVITSDHGEEFLDHHMLRHGQSLFEEQLHVPLLVRGPGIEPGRFEPPVETRSIFDLGLAVADNSAGRWLEAVAQRSQQGRPVFSTTDHAQFPGVDGRHSLTMLRDGRWKYISPAANGRVAERLFDLSTDPGERGELTGHEEVLERYRGITERWLQQQATNAPTRADEPNPEILEALRSLGYID